MLNRLGDVVRTNTESIQQQAAPIYNAIEAVDDSSSIWEVFRQTQKWNRLLLFPSL